MKGVLKLYIVNEPALIVKKYDDRFDVIIRDKKKVMIETRETVMANAGTKYFLKINPEREMPDYYKQDDIWYNYHTKEMIIDDDVIHLLNIEFKRHYEA